MIRIKDRNTQLKETIDVNYYEKDIFDRTKRYLGENKFQKIRNSSVLLVGAGAVGNEVSKNLGLLGVGEIKLVDFDIVVKSNLNRCIFFREEDHGHKYKVDAIKERLEKISQTKIKPYPVRIEDAPDEVWDVDLIIIGVDDNYARYYINSKNLSFDNPKPMINGAMGKDFVQVDILYPPHTACLVCPWTQSYANTVLEEKVKQKCDEYFINILPKFPMISFVTSFVGAIIATEAVKILTLENINYKINGKDKKKELPLFGKSIIYNLNTHKSQVLSILPNPKCVEPLCRKKRKKS